MSKRAYTPTGLFKNSRRLILNLFCLVGRKSRISRSVPLTELFLIAEYKISVNSLTVQLQNTPASEMTYIVSCGALNSTH